MPLVRRELGVGYIIGYDTMIIKKTVLDNRWQNLSLERRFLLDQEEGRA